MKNKGFTLVELLAVITILAVIAIIAVPNVLRTINNSRGKLSTVQMDTLEKACKNYVTSNVGKIDDCSFVTLNDLYKAGHLENNHFSNPKGGTFGENSGFVVEWSEEINQYTYEFHDSDPGKC